MTDTDRPTPPLGSETLFAKKIGEAVARQMAKAHPKAATIPPHRWAQKLTRLGQRLVFVGFAVVSVKLAWPVYVQIAAAVMALRALSPDLADGSLRWVLSLARQGKAIKDGAA